MHFGYPPRKTSAHTPYPLRARRPQIRRSQLQLLALIALGILSVFYLLSKFFGSSTPSGLPKPPPGTPKVVIVSVIDAHSKKWHKDVISQNRRDYAARHGYEVFLPNLTDYNVGNYPSSWAKVPAMRHGMTLYPHTEFFWFLGPYSLIINAEKSLEEHVLADARLESLMLVDVPVVPPDSVIKTFSHVKGDRVDLILTQDTEGLSQESWIIRRGEWAKYFLDAWFDPIYRSYNFQKAEAHALEHLVQWHGTILAKLALIPLRTMNSYSDKLNLVTPRHHYRDGDLVVTFIGCAKGFATDGCKEQMTQFAKKSSTAPET